jgi:hypothetical protein
MRDRLYLSLDKEEAEHVIGALSEYRNRLLRLIGEVPERACTEQSLNESVDTLLRRLQAIRSLLEETESKVDAAFSPGEVAR